MRRLLIGFILLFAVTIQAQERRVEDWMVWLYLPDSGTLLFNGFYTEPSETVNYAPISFERNLQVPEDAQTLPDTVIVSDDASTLAYVLIPNNALGGTTFPNIIVSEIFKQGFYIHEIPTFDANSVSVVFHSDANIQAGGHALYGVQQRIPAFANPDPDRERIIAYAYQNISDLWRIEIFDVNAEQLLHQFDEVEIPELVAEKILVHSYHNDEIVFSAITGDTERLYEWSLASNTSRELPLYLVQTQSTDVLANTGEALAIDGDALLYHATPDANGSELFSSPEMLLPRFVQSGERIAFAQSPTSLSLIERDGTLLIPDFTVANVTQIIGVSTGFIYAVETEAFSLVSYYHTDSDDFAAKENLIWGSFEGEAPVEIVYVHHGAE